MSSFNVFYDVVPLTRIPNEQTVKSITERMMNRACRNVNNNSFSAFVKQVGSGKHTFCPSTFDIGFYDVSISRDNFKQTQLFILEFNNGTTHEEVLNRANNFNIPVLFAYEPFDSVEQSKFRAVFLNDVPVDDIRAADIIQFMLMVVFPEADRNCNDVTAFSFGGKKLLYSDESMPTIDLESLNMNMSYFLKLKYGDTNYKRKLKDISKDSNVLLNQNNLLDITLTELDNSISSINKNMPKPIINQSVIIGLGTNLPNLGYQIKLSTGQSDCTSNNCLSTKTRTSYRPSVLNSIGKYCKLYNEFATGERKLEYKELVGLASNMVQVESGAGMFCKYLLKQCGDTDTDHWSYCLSYMRQSDCKPKNCYLYCPYKDKCTHGENILTTGNPKTRTVEKLANYEETYYPLDVVERDLEYKLQQAIMAKDNKLHVIVAQTAIGKTETYLVAMKDSTEPFLIAVPTNILKNEVCARAKAMGINVMVTPSLDEIKDDMPKEIWKHIDHLYKTGYHRSVHPYIRRLLKKRDVPCLREYMQKLVEFKDFDGHVITTHRKMLLLDEEKLKKFSTVIIDEDIIFRSIIPDQKAITIKELEKIKDNTTNPQLFKKIDKALGRARKDSLFKLPSFEYNDKEGRDGTSSEVDIPSFCMATHFCLRKASEKRNLNEDTIVYIKPTKLKSLKYIMVSATANKDICNYYFGEDMVNFVECKKAKYEGKLNQYYEKSMSRACIDTSQDIFDSIKRWSGFERTITFKKYGKDILHFGNTEGFDEWAGDNIDVIGTPYHAEFLYRLFAFMVGSDGDLTERMRPNYPIIRNGYSFRFTTYDNDALRAIHLWMIESELEQAVGRARLLRNKCCVNLFSNFPLNQANLLPSEYEID